MQSIQLSKSAGNKVRFRTWLLDSTRRESIQTLAALLRSFGVTEGNLRSRSPDERPANRSRSRSERLAEVGGEYRARTGDLLVANQALSQLS